VNRRTVIQALGLLPLAALTVAAAPAKARSWSIECEMVADVEKSTATGWLIQAPTGRRAWSIEGRVVGKREFIENMRLDRPDMVPDLEAFDEALLLTEHPKPPAAPALITPDTLRAQGLDPVKARVFVNEIDVTERYGVLEAQPGVNGYIKFFARDKAGAVHHNGAGALSIARMDGRVDVRFI
jgi:hypothetical protein